MADRPRQYHQDYIARIRYSNALPPPPCPPKLLHIPNTGLSSGHYTSAGFASRLAREQPVNIEADAELGMPIDLVGIPGVFDGNETAIQTMDKPPKLSSADLALMRAPTSLGKATRDAATISFLRRTEYTTAFAGAGSKFESSNSTNTILTKKKRRRQDLQQNDPLNIARNIQKGFDIAYPADAYTGPEEDGKVRAPQISPEEKQAWRVPKHPSKPGVTLVDSYPLLPDWDALPDTGSYMVYKFTAPPVKEAGAYDKRIDVALLRPAGVSVEDQELYIAEQAAYKEDPSKPVPTQRYHFEFFLPPETHKSKVGGIKRNFTTRDPDNESEISFDEGQDEDGNPRKYFKYENVRTYETQTATGDTTNPYGEIVALALHDPESHGEDPLRTTQLQKAAYFYPVGHRLQIRPKRPGKTEMVGDEMQRVDIIETAARAPNEQEVEKREALRQQYDYVDA